MQIDRIPSSSVIVKFQNVIVTYDSFPIIRHTTLGQESLSHVTSHHAPQGSLHHGSCGQLAADRWTDPAIKNMLILLVHDFFVLILLFIPNVLFPILPAIFFYDLRNVLSH